MGRVEVLRGMSTMRKIRAIAELGTLDTSACVLEIIKFLTKEKMKAGTADPLYIIGVIHGTLLRARNPDILEQIVIPLIDRSIEIKEAKF